MRVSEEKQPKQVEGLPCTDFDMAYFHSYSHVGIHEEMIKVCFGCFRFYLGELLMHFSR